MLFSEAVWNSGFVSVAGHLFLLVTLDKSGKGSDFQYKDRFLSADEAKDYGLVDQVVVSRKEIPSETEKK